MLSIAINLIKRQSEYRSEIHEEPCNQPRPTTFLTTSPIATSCNTLRARIIVIAHCKKSPKDCHIAYDNINNNHSYDFHT
mmetsp:Transcript_3846/g.8577  ORF Transcript_3846/g.8577 Transcript_3846/m.8577 type:complete len:80 (-) Transcript_3846:154-393(-)